MGPNPNLARLATNAPRLGVNPQSAIATAAQGMVPQLKHPAYRLGQYIAKNHPADAAWMRGLPGIKQGAFKPPVPLPMPTPTPGPFARVVQSFNVPRATMPTPTPAPSPGLSGPAESVSIPRIPSP